MIKAKIDRLEMSEQVLQSWEKMLEAGVLTVENLSLARNEVSNLQAYRHQDPEWVDDLVRRYTAIADSLASKVN